MELNMGAAIRKLRTKAGVTQEELAEYIGISPQAVSKWECNATMTDIALLPHLAVFFGVRIDDLFSVNTDDELERIDHILTNEKLTDENFTYASRTLDAILRDNPDNTGALKRYAMLYLARINRDSLAAGRLLEHAMTLSPSDEEIFILYRTARGADHEAVRSGCDWFLRVCEPYAEKHPGNVKLYQLLIGTMIKMRYFDRAEKLIGQMKADDEFAITLPIIFRGDLALAKGEVEEAKRLWTKVNPENHKGQYEVGDRFNWIGEYEEAIVHYNNSFAAAKHPRDLSAVYSLAFLYTKLGRNREAIAAWQTILDVLASDYGTTEGETADWSRREIENLKIK